MINDLGVAQLLVPPRQFIMKPPQLFFNYRLGFIKMDDLPVDSFIETALGGNIQNIVTEDEGTAKRMIAFLKKHKAGRATFLPLTSITEPQEFKHSEALKEEGVVAFTFAASSSISLLLPRRLLLFLKAPPLIAPPGTRSSPSSVTIRIP